MPRTIYVCEYCKAQFEDRMDARWCEIQHQHRIPVLIKNEEFLHELIREHKNPCDYCEHSYYVYGTELNCDCRDKCQRMFQDYLLFVGKELKDSGLYQ